MRGSRAKRSLWLLCALPLSAAGLAAVSGGPARTASAARYTVGAAASDAFVSERGSLIEMERETLIFRVSEFPDGPDCSEYRSCVEANYVLYNPSSEDVPLEMYVPCNTAAYFSDGTADCSISLDGAAVSPTLRHTYFAAQRNEECLRADSKIEAGLYAEDAPVTVRTYRCNSEGYLHLVFQYVPSETELLFCGAKTSFDKTGKLHAVHKGGSDGAMTVYSVGAPARQTDAYVTEDAAGEGERMSAMWSLREETTTFGALAESLRPADGEIGEADWFNGCVDYLAAADKGGVCEAFDAFGACCFRRWYQYSFVVPHGGRTTSTVVSPLYPDVDGGLYRYKYDLTPALRWGAFGGIDIRVETPFRLTGSSWSFTEGEGGYSFSQDYFPLGELSFSLSETDAAELPFSQYHSGAGTVDVLVIVLGVVAGVVIVAVGAAIVVKQRRRARKRAEQERGATEEGKLPDDGEDGKQ